ncbi:MAG: rhamnulokinase, partial [Bacteroidales bacterium]|nr:rhamnulokinase [Bacteroidales bacterium]
VVAVAGHDTSWAVDAVPAEGEGLAYLSSGTWSLMGIEVKDPIITEDSFSMNFTNEGGVEGTTRFLKNITGMWLLEQCRKEWKKKQNVSYSYPVIEQLGTSADAFRSLVDPDDPCFANPPSMTQAIEDYCKKTGQPVPVNHAQFIRCIYDSLALKYKCVLNNLQNVAPFKIEKLHIIGGGAVNKLMSQLTANAVGIPVVCGPGEATAIGNVMMQAKAVGVVNSLPEMRQLIAKSIQTNIYLPEDQTAWELAYRRYCQIIEQK